MIGLVAPAVLSCFIIQGYVNLFGEQSVIDWAHRHGYTDKQIEVIRKRCEGVHNDRR